MHKIVKLEKPKEYEQNTLSSDAVIIVLNKYKDKMRWRSDGLDTLLDIGCGPGKITQELLIPFLPDTFRKIVGADISRAMLEHAKEHYSHPKLSFTTIDIEDDDIEQYMMTETFDHITGFFLLHLVDNQTLAMKNVYNLLNENGDCMFITFAYMSLYDAYLQLPLVDKWKPYLIDTDKWLSYYLKNPNDNEFEKTLIAGGFTDYDIEIRHGSHAFANLDQIRGVWQSVLPVYNIVPKELQLELLDEIVKISCPTSDITKPDSEFTVTYKLIIAYARK